VPLPRSPSSWSMPTRLTWRLPVPDAITAPAAELRSALTSLVVACSKLSRAEDNLTTTQAPHGRRRRSTTA
jgi:hypothetical protein